MSDRGMMKWAPYKSLVEQEDALKTAKSKKSRIEKPSISSDLAEEINRLLVSYKGQEVLVKYWLDGYIYEESGSITRIDSYSKTLMINRKTINFSSLVNIEEL